MVGENFVICDRVRTMFGTKFPNDRSRYTRNANLMSAAYNPAGA